MKEFECSLGRRSANLGMDLGKLRPENAQVLAALLKGAADEESYCSQRWRRASLGEVAKAHPENGQVLSALRKGVADQERFVRVAVQRSLGSVAKARPDNEQVLEALLKGVVDKEPSVQNAAYVSLEEVAKARPDNEQVLAALFKGAADRLVVCSCGGAVEFRRACERAPTTRNGSVAHPLRVCH